MSIAYSYETFIRKAFGHQNGSGLVGRSEDPASLANTDFFYDSHINKVKIAVAYSMEIFRSEISNSGKIDNDNEDTRLEDFIDRVMVTTSVSAISDLIEEFNTTVLNKYFNINDGIMTFK